MPLLPVLLPSFSNKPEIGAYPEAARYLVSEHPGTPPFLATVLVVMSEAARWGAYVVYICVCLGVCTRWFPGT